LHIARTLYNKKDAFRVEQNGQTQSRPKRRKKSSDLRRRLKTVSDADEVTLDGKLFHTREAATGNARSPMVEWRIGSTTSDDVERGSQTPS